MPATIADSIITGLVKLTPAQVKALTGRANHLRPGTPPQTKGVLYRLGLTDSPTHGHPITHLTEDGRRVRAWLKEKKR